MPTRTTTSQRSARSRSARATLSRRDFVRLLTVASAAAGVGVAVPRARAGDTVLDHSDKTASKKPAAPAKPAFTAEEHKEIARQVKPVDGALKKIRAYKLPAGSEPATHFQVIRPRGGGKRA